MAYKIKLYRGWKIKKLRSGKGKGLLYAEKGDTSFGILGGENSVKEIKQEINSRSRK